MYGKFKRFNLSKEELRGVANIIAHEQGSGSVVGMLAEASLIANRAELTKKSIKETCCGGWFAHGKKRFEEGTSNAVANHIAETVMNYGYRSVPLYVNEHDCLSDISEALNGKTNVRGNRKAWKRFETKIKNVYDSTWYFYDFPGGLGSGVDPFGSTYKEADRNKLGHFCHTIEECKERRWATVYNGKLITQYPKRGYFQKGDNYPGVGIIQNFLNWKYTDQYLDPDCVYGEKTKKMVSRFQKDMGLPVNGCWGKLCNAKAKIVKR